MCECRFVEHELVAKPGTDEINKATEEPNDGQLGSQQQQGFLNLPGDEEQAQSLPVNVVPWPLAHTCIF